MLPDISYGQTCANIPLLHSHVGQGRCNWYAMARAFKRDTTAPCIANTFKPNSGTLNIDTKYFIEHDKPEDEDEINFSELIPGDIIEFDTGRHYAFVTSYGGSLCDHKPDPDSPPEKNKTISQI